MAPVPGGAPDPRPARAGATLTAKSFDRVHDAVVTMSSWLRALSTLISWSCCGEQGVHFMFRGRGSMTCKLVCCALIVVACMGFVTNDRELDALTALGTGVMLVVNVPLTLLFGCRAMRAFRDCMRRLQSGAMRPPHERPPPVDVLEGRDV